MILFRYFNRDLLQTLLGISSVLLLIIMSGRFIRYLAQAAQGALSPDILFTIIAYRIPGFLELILPLALFLGILLTHGRCYVENEMTVLFACGVSQKQLFGMLFPVTMLITCVVISLSFWITPWCLKQVELIVAQQKTAIEFDTIQAGRFEKFKNGSLFLYVEKLNQQDKELRNVFIAQLQTSKGQSNQILFLARSGHQEMTPHGRNLILNDGYRYNGLPGKANFQVIHYDTYSIRLPNTTVPHEVFEEDTLFINQLLHHTDNIHLAELQWRLSIILLVPIMFFIAVPLAKVKPRQGRFIKILPAVILYLLYLSSLIILKNAIHDGIIPPALGLWPVHIIFIVIGALLNYGTVFARLLGQCTNSLKRLTSDI